MKYISSSIANINGITSIYPNHTNHPNLQMVRQPKEILTIGFVGLPASGKTSIINSLISTDIQNDSNIKLHNEIITDDNQNQFRTIYFPSIGKYRSKYTTASTMQDFEESFNNYLASSDIIFWVSDITTAFLTNFEIDEYAKLKKRLENISLETEKHIQLAIILSKCDREDAQTLNDIATILPNEYIMRYNAYGHTLTSCNPRSTKYIRTTTILNGAKINTDTNIKFSLSEIMKIFKANQLLHNKRMATKAEYAILDAFVNKYQNIGMGEDYDPITSSYKSQRKTCNILRTIDYKYDITTEKLLHTIPYHFESLIDEFRNLSIDNQVRYIGILTTDKTMDKIVQSTIIRCIYVVDPQLFTTNMFVIDIYQRFIYDLFCTKMHTLISPQKQTDLPDLSKQTVDKFIADFSRYVPRTDLQHQYITSICNSNRTSDNILNYSKIATALLQHYIQSTSEPDLQIITKLISIQNELLYLKEYFPMNSDNDNAKPIITKISKGRDSDSDSDDNRNNSDNNHNDRSYHPKPAPNKIVINKNTDRHSQIHNTESTESDDDPAVRCKL